MWLNDPDLDRHPRVVYVAGQQGWDSTDRQGTGRGGEFRSNTIARKDAAMSSLYAQPAGPAAPAPPARTAPAAKTRPESKSPPGEPGGSKAPQGKPGTSDPNAPQYRARINGKDIPGGPLPSTSQVQGRNGVPAPGHNQVAQTVAAQNQATGGMDPMSIIQNMMASGNPQLMQMAAMLLPAVLAASQFQKDTGVRDMGALAQSKVYSQLLGNERTSPVLDAMIESKVGDLFRQQMMASGISPGTFDYLDLGKNPHLVDHARKQESQASSAREAALRSWMSEHGVTEEKTRGGDTYYTRDGRFFAGPQDIQRKFGPLSDQSRPAHEREAMGKSQASASRANAATNAGIFFDPENPALAYTLGANGEKIPVELAQGSRATAIPYKYDW